MKNILILLLTSLMVVQAFAQRDPNNVWNWPEDRATAEEKNVLYSDYVRSEEYAGAVEPLEWLIEKAPNLNPSIYINGAKIYERLAEVEENDAKKLGYQERALDMYDLRIKYFNNEVEVLNRKTFTAYKYYKSRSSKYVELKELFDKTFEVVGYEVFDNNLMAYMDVVRRYKLANKEIGDEEILDIYSTITEIIDFKIKQGRDEERLKTISDHVDKILAATIDVECDFVEKNLGPKLAANPDDSKLAKKIFQLMLTGKCTNSPLALQAAEVVHAVEPSFGLAKFIASRSQLDKNYDKAYQHYLQAIDLADDKGKRAEAYLDMARLKVLQGAKESARTFSYKAINENSGLKQAYSLLGNIYMSSYENCREGISRVQDRAIFIAAYEMYSRAGDISGMNNAREQFPSMEEIFTEGKEVGEVVTVGCWINETVQLDRRPAN